MIHRIRMFLTHIWFRKFLGPGGLLEPLFNDWKQGRINDKEFGSGAATLIKSLEQE